MENTGIFSPENETKAEHFVRIAEPRTNNVIKSLEFLTHCSGATFEYTDEQVEEMFNAIQMALDTAKESFKRKLKVKKERFIF